MVTAAGRIECDHAATAKFLKHHAASVRRNVNMAGSKSQGPIVPSDGQNGKSREDGRYSTKMKTLEPAHKLSTYQRTPSNFII